MRKDSDYAALKNVHKYVHNEQFRANELFKKVDQINMHLLTFSCGTIS